MPGPENDEGGFQVGTNQTLSYDHIESISVTGGGPVTLSGTNGNDAITIIARDSSTHAGTDGIQDFTVSINAGPEFLFINTPAFSINDLGGDDVITVRTPAPNGAVLNVQLTLNGGPPTASDKVSSKRRSSATKPPFTPTGTNSER